MIMMRYYFLFRHRTSLLEDFSPWCITVSCLSLKSSRHLQSVALSGWINGINWQWRTKSTLLNKGKVFNIRKLDEALLLRVRKRINFESSPEPMATMINKILEFLLNYTRLSKVQSPIISLLCNKLQKPLVNTFSALSSAKKKAPFYFSQPCMWTKLTVKIC